jgi:hypothetical protein
LRRHGIHERNSENRRNQKATIYCSDTISQTESMRKNRVKAELRERYEKVGLYSH